MKISLEEATAKALEGKLTESNSNSFKDYIILKDYEGGWMELFFFNKELTNGDLERIDKIIQKVKDEKPTDYTNEDIEDEINKILPYTDTIILGESEGNNVFYY